MSFMFARASAFNQDIGGWAVDSVTNMRSLFYGASAFDQDLGWCVDDDVSLDQAFEGTPCAAASCGVFHMVVPSCGGTVTHGDGSIRFAVAAWLSDSAAAEATYGHISTWETGGVTDTSCLFAAESCYSGTQGGWYQNSAAVSFNEDISAWDTSGVTSMYRMFYKASAFNQDIGGWAVHSVTDMAYIVHNAEAFDQDLGWCVDDGVDLNFAFSGTPCASTSCGVTQADGACVPTPRPTPRPTIVNYVMTDSTIKTAVTAWLSDSAAAEATYGHISTWETGGVTDMSYLFCGLQWDTTKCNMAAASFNEDIGAWDTSGVTTMSEMFYYASSFNQDIGDWAVHSVTSMYYMFYSASAFDQNLGWCVGDDTYLFYAFRYTPCESTSCGVVRCSASPQTQGPKNNKEQIPVAIIAGAAAAALLLAFGAFYFYRRRKASMTEKADEPSSANREPTELSAPEEATSPKEEEATIPVAPEGEEASTEQPPPPPPRRWFSRAEPEPEAAAPKTEETYNQIAAWYNAPENAALRATWGAYPEPDDFQTWPGFVAVTNAFLDREAG
jgi:hypothetical protein